MTPTIVTPGRVRVMLGVAALAIVGCGSDGAGASGSAAAPEADLTVEAHDIDFDSDEYTLASGEQRVAYLQAGDTRHTLLVETADGVAVDGFELEVDDSSSDVGTVDLEAGRYTFYCDVPGHREAGMEADLVVNDRAATASSGRSFSTGFRPRPARAIRRSRRPGDRIAAHDGGLDDPRRAGEGGDLRHPSPSTPTMASMSTAATTAAMATSTIRTPFVSSTGTLDATAPDPSAGPRTCPEVAAARRSRLPGDDTAAAQHRPWPP